MKTVKLHDGSVEFHFHSDEEEAEIERLKQAYSNWLGDRFDTLQDLIDELPGYADDGWTVDLEAFEEFDGMRIYRATRTESGFIVAVVVG